MGYRLSIEHNNEEIYYGTKYYGYNAGVKLNDIIYYGSKSCKYLLDKGYVNEDNWWWYSDNKIKLNKSELLKFIKLYIDDLRRENKKKYAETRYCEGVFEELEKVYKEIKEKYSKDDNYTIDWY